MDTEIVAVDSEGSVMSFQDLSNRPRKDVQLEDVQVTVCVFAFDLMYLDGEVCLIVCCIYAQH
jgi:DNA ligase 1